MITEIFVYSEDVTHATELIGMAIELKKKVAVITSETAAANYLCEFGVNIVYQFDKPPCAKDIVALMENSMGSVFVAGSTVYGRELAAGVAGMLDCGMISDIRSIELCNSGLKASHMVHGGTLKRVECVDAPCVITVPNSVFKKAPVSSKCNIVEKAAFSDNRIKLISRQAIVRGSVDIKQAEHIVGVGLGLNKEEDMNLIRELAAILNAELGCTRSVAEEKKWLAEEHLVGITGAQVKPELYLAVGISGQVQHVFGLRDSKIIAAINKDENAPIFKVCDYGVVADLYEIIPELISLLKNA